ncbi:hypothetical protein BASA60_002472 [Batrachochytrium salamandrivorans]|nr:hypothetical protein BASA60_002472 [Batrachochytrium salamandrivorans]
MIVTAYSSHKLASFAYGSSSSTCLWLTRWLDKEEEEEDSGGVAAQRFLVRKMKYYGNTLVYQEHHLLLQLLTFCIVLGSVQESPHKTTRCFGFLVVGNCTNHGSLQQSLRYRLPGITDATVFKSPDVILCNGPGTCVPMAVLAVWLRCMGIINTRVVYVESLARVQDLSLSGKILYRIVDQFVVQWPQLKMKYPNAVYVGRLV